MLFGEGCSQQGLSISIKLVYSAWNPKPKMCSLLTQPSLSWNHAANKTEKKREKQYGHATVYHQKFICLSVLTVVASLLLLGLSGATRKDTAGNLHCHNRTPFLPKRPIFKALISHFPSFFFLLCMFLVKNNSGVKPAGQCGTWVKESEGGLFTSPNYPNKYPPDTECVYILEGKSSF